jgi:hypothetical protein
MYDDQDKLFEALTINREICEPLSPLFDGYGPIPRFWSYYGQQFPVRQSGKHNDIVYTNAEGKKHRIYGPAYISSRFKIEAWYKDGKLHREGGPAYIHKNNMVWFYEGMLHRLDGPAVVEYGGPKQYWIMGKKYSPKEYKKEIARKKRKGSIK